MNGKMKGFVGGLIFGLVGRAQMPKVEPPAVEPPTKEPVAFLYNGVRLPKLPETAYPNAVIVYNFLFKRYYLFVTDAPANIQYFNDGKLYVSPSATGPGAYWNQVNGAWEIVEDNESQDYGHAPEYLVWTNHNVHYADDIPDVGGTLFMESTDPIPVYE